MAEACAVASVNLREKALTMKKLCGNIEDVHCTFAEVAELADALRSGRSDRTVVGVQIPPSAPLLSALAAVFFRKGRIVGLVRRFAKPLLG